MLAALAGCGGAADGARLVGATAPAVTQAASRGFKGTEEADGMKMTLAIDPLQVGDNHIRVVLNTKDVAAVEAQIIMGTMGHGDVIDLARGADPAQWEAGFETINMDGKWLVRVQATLPDGTEKAALFQFNVAAPKAP